MESDFLYKGVSLLQNIEKINHKFNPRVMRILLFILLSFCYLFIFVNDKGQAIIKAEFDGQFHFSRIMSLQNIWTSPVDFNYFNHTGIIVNLVYPWPMVYPIFLFTKLTHDVVLSYYIYLLIMTFVTLELTYWCVKKMKQSTVSAIVTATLYTFTMCRTSDIYFRMALGEVVGITFLPIVVLGIYRIFYQEQPQWVTLTIGMTLLVYSHVISVVMAATAVGIFFITSLIHKKLTKQKIVALVKATLTTIVLGLGFFVPMLQILLSVDLNKPGAYNLFQAASKPDDFLLKSISNTVDGTDTLSFVFLIIIVILIIKWKDIKGFFKDSLIVGLLFVIMSTQLFPWEPFQKIFAIIQFPWRFIGLATLLLSIAFSQVIVSYQKKSHKDGLKVALLVISAVVVGHFATLDSIGNINGLNIGNSSSFYTKAISKNALFNGRDDYAPKDTNLDVDVINNQMICANAAWHKLKAKVTANKVTYTYHSPNETTAFLPVYHYPGEKVIQNGVEIPAQASADGATYVNLVKGTNTFEISYGYTSLARLAWIISLIAAIIFNGLILISKRKHKQKLEK